MAATDNPLTVNDYAVRISHLVDDYEKMRTKSRRELRRANELLSNGLHALRNGSPAVTDEFIERALANISTAIDALAPRP
jgi:hypothetical protein